MGKEHSGDIFIRKESCNLPNLYYLHLVSISLWNLKLFLERFLLKIVNNIILTQEAN